MKVHHLNCGSMRLPTYPLVCHVLLAEAEHGLVLVDSGFGAGDCADPRRRIGPVRRLTRPALSRTETVQNAEDRDGSPVFLARNAWELGYIAEKAPKVKFSDIRERS